MILVDANFPIHLLRKRENTIQQTKAKSSLPIKKKKKKEMQLFKSLTSYAIQDLRPHYSALVPKILQITPSKTCVWIGMVSFFIYKVPVTVSFHYFDEKFCSLFQNKKCASFASTK